MSDSLITKRALAAAMKELMNERPMEKIKIGDIVERCGMNRQSFYYHFKDKYDLVNWIFYTEFLAGVQDVYDENGWDLFEKICEYFYSNRIFYSNAFQVSGQNSLPEYFEEVMHPLLLAECRGFFENDKDREFYATFMADAIRVSITRWLVEGAKIPAEKFVQLMKTAASGVYFTSIDQRTESVISQSD
jgi:probable dihydroxyacetone kinase regulator